MKIYLYSFTKKVNSTKQPTGGTEFDANLKAPSSIINPRLEMAADCRAFNYCYIPDFDRYYFINDITYNAGLWILDLSVDVLASYKTVIGNTDMYVVRASYTHDAGIIDNEYPAKTGPSINETTFTFPDISWSGFENGYYVLGVKGQTPESTNAVIYFQLTPSQLSVVLHSFYANSGSSWWGNLQRGIINSLNKIDDFIVSCRWYPFQFPASTTAKVFIGSFETTVTADVLTDYPNISKSVTLTYGTHPQAATRGGWLNHEPFSKYELFDPFIGRIQLNYDDLATSANRQIRVSITPDFTTGEAVYSVGPVISQLGFIPFYTSFFHLGVDVPLSGADVSVSGLLNTTAAAAENILTGDWLGVSANIGNAITQGFAQPGYQRSSGGYSQIAAGGRCLRSYHYEMTDDDNANRGRPYCRVRKPSVIPGYILADNPKVETNGTANENDMINSYLENGFYYE